MCSTEVGTLFAIYRLSLIHIFGEALLYGQAITHRILTVSGHGVKEPQNVKVPVGVAASEVVAACGGYAFDEVKLIAGGPMMGKTDVYKRQVIYTVSSFS